MLGEEQEFDLSPLKQRLPGGATTVPSGCCGEQRKLTYSPPSPPSLAPLDRTRIPTATSIRQESSDGELSSGISTISDINREPLSIDTERYTNSRIKETVPVGGAAKERKNLPSPLKAVDVPLSPDSSPA